MEHDKITTHYHTDNLSDFVLQALEKEKGSLKDLKVHDLVPIEGFHIRGRKSTVELSELLQIKPTDNILDVGSGPGGAARYLASQYGCHVVGLDLTPSYVSLAAKLSELVGFQEFNEFKSGNALEMPFENNRFDIVWAEHVQMNISRKEEFISEISRVLRPSGCLAINEVFRGEKGDPYLPAPWSSDKSTSFMVSAEDMKQLYEDANFTVLEWRDVTDVSNQWFQGMLKRMETKGLPPFGVHLLMGQNAKEKMANVGRSLADGRAKVILAVLENKGSY
jgi:ubiquinone/menaquinone biosynthesis C-methylase UbiE